MVRRFAAIVNGGSVRVSKRVNRVNRENHHTIHIWECGKWADSERILRAFLPYLGERRRAKALEMLADPAGPVGRKPGDLSPAAQAAIRAAWATGTLRQREIARQFGISQGAVSRTVNA